MHLCSYADRENAYWTGYFTSRPALKRYIRIMSGYYLVLFLWMLSSSSLSYVRNDFYVVLFLDNFYVVLFLYLQFIARLQGNWSFSKGGVNQPTQTH